MKKLTLLSLVLMISLSYGQTKKKSNSKKIATPTTPLEERITIVKADSNRDADIVLEPDNGPTMMIEDDTIIYNPAGIEVKPEFPGGNEKLFSFISRNFKYTDEMIENELKGRIMVSFIVERDGSLTDIKVVRGLGFGAEKEALRVLKLMPKWNCGEQNGRKVRCSYLIPITIYATK